MYLHEYIYIYIVNLLHKHGKKQTKLLYLSHDLHKWVEKVGRPVP